MKKNKPLISVIAVFAILLVLFVVLTTVIPFTKIGSSWVAFSFGIVSIIAACAITIYSFTKGEAAVSKFYRLSLFKLGIYYLVIQLLVSLTLFILGAFFLVPTWVGVIACIVPLCFCGVGLILVDNAIDIVETQDKKVEVNVKEMKTFNVSIGKIIAICQNDEYLPYLENLEEAFKYSDPVSSDETASLEEDLKVKIGVLEVLVAENSESVIPKIKEIEVALSSRNAVCKLAKHR